MKYNAWFEIGLIKDSGETETVYVSDLLSECIAVFKERKYNKEQYFIDVWEMTSHDCPVPIANVVFSSQKR